MKGPPFLKVVDFFRGEVRREACNFYEKNKLKSGIFSDKKKVFKLSNWKILTKNLVTFKK